MSQTVSSFRTGQAATVRTAYPTASAEVYDERRFTKPCGHRIHAFELDRLLWAVEHVPREARLFEVGCGTGRLLVELLRRGYHVDGLDASEPMLAESRLKLRQESLQSVLHAAEATNTGQPDNAYDLVYAIRLLNQTESPDYALDVVREMVRITRQGGFILAEFVNDLRPRWGAANRPKRSCPTRLRPRQVAAASEQAGADVVAYRGCFFLGMQTYHAAPRPLLPPVAALDRLTSALFPRLCARTFILLQKRRHDPLHGS